MRGQPPNVLYSVVIRRGPDVSHYDVVAEEDGIHFLYLGEHWEAFRPRTGMQKRMDLFIYSMRKKRRRQSDERRVEDFRLDYCEVKDLRIVKGGVEDSVGRLVLTTVSGLRIEIEYSMKIHEVVKEFVKIVKRAIERKCGKEA